MKTTWRILVVLLSVYMMITGLAFGQVPQLINYQGVLINPSTSQPVPDDTYTIVFSIYDVASGGSPVWTETQSVTTKTGVYNVLLGSTNPLTTTIFSGPEKYLGIKVGSDDEMTPRKQIVSVAYAILSEDADKLDGKDAATFIEKVNNVTPLNGNIDLVAGSNITISPGEHSLTIAAAGGGGGGWVDDGTVVRLETSTDKVGIGTTSPQAKLHIGGSTPNSAFLNIIDSPSGFRVKVATDVLGNPFIQMLDAGSLNTNVIHTNGNSYFCGGNVGIGDPSPTHQLDVAGKIGIHDTQVLYLPDQTDFEGTLYLGDGGASLNKILSPDGHFNTATGIGALYANTTGNYNTANGYQSLYSNTTGHENTAIGYKALYNNTTQYSNTAVGLHTGWNTSTRGTFLGGVACPLEDGYSNVMGLGYDARPTASNQVRIGNSAVTSIGGYADWTNFSDGRYKLAVTENVKGLGFIMKLRPVTYQLDVNRLAADLKEGQRWDEQGNITTESSELDIKARQEKSQIVYTGFIGQEVEQAAKEIGYNFSGVDAPKNEHDFYGLRYAEFVVPLVKAVQEQQKIIEDLRNEITALKKRLGE